ncbi:MAG TPA: DUF6799 domain-containing protein [Planctomycetota bacterium]|nr:DUF6799 domain-containing protein [Planctomycetota bacterium]
MLKGISLVALCLALLSWGTLAAEGHREGYAFRNGKVVLMKGGNETVVTTEVKLNNGVRILPEGFIVTREGVRERFPADRWLSLEGDFVAVDGGPDVIVDDDFDGYYLEDGRVYVIRDHRPVLVTAEITLGNGSRLEADGTIITKEGTRSKLTAGQRISKEGKMVEGKAATPRTGTTPRTGADREQPINTSRNPENAVKNTQPEKTAPAEHAPEKAKTQETTPNKDEKTQTQDKK